jgi:SAM-dependent methyltransferase
MGYVVSLLDPSVEMLRQARAALAAEAPDVATRLRLIQGWGEQAPRILGTAGYDIVLCHAVLPYVASPGPLLEALAALVRPGGIVSILIKNAAALAMRSALEGRYRDALAALDADRDRGGLGAITRADTVADITAQMECVGIPLVEWYGIRIFTDHVGNRSADAARDTVLTLEWEAGRRDPYRSVARLVHLIGQRCGDAVPPDAVHYCCAVDPAKGQR